MKPQVGQHVKCILKNSVVIEGKVKEWTSGECVLVSMDRRSLIIIPSPDQEILMIKIMFDFPIEDVMEHPVMEVDPPEKIPELDPEHLRVKKIVELRQMAKKQDAEIISSKLREHIPSPDTRVKYGTPRFYKK